MQLAVNLPNYTLKLCRMVSLLPLVVQSIAMSVSVCLAVCSLACLKNNASKFSVTVTCPCIVAEWSTHSLGHYVQWSVTHLRSRVHNSVLVRSLSTKEFFQIIAMHMMNREIIRA